MSTFLARIGLILSHADCHTDRVDFSFLGLTNAEMKILSNLLSKCRVKYIDLRRGNNDLHTKEDIMVIDECIKNNPQIKKVYMKPGVLEAVWASPTSPSTKLDSIEVTASFQSLCQTTSVHENTTKDLAWATALLSRHRIPNLDVILCPNDIEEYLGELRVQNRESDAKDLRDAMDYISRHGSLDSDIRTWAMDFLKKHGIREEVCNRARVELCIAKLNREQRQDEGKLLNRAVGYIRDYVHSVLQFHHIQEWECASDIVSIRNKIDNLRRKSSGAQGDELEVVMELAATSDLQPPKRKRGDSPMGNRHVTKGGVQIIRRRR